MTFLTWDWDFWTPRTRADAEAALLRPPAGMAINDDPTAGVREQRYKLLVSDLLPKVRRLNPGWSDDEVLEMAESMAEMRLLDEEIG